MCDDAHGAHAVERTEFDLHACVGVFVCVRSCVVRTCTWKGKLLRSPNFAATHQHSQPSTPSPTTKANAPLSSFDRIPNSSSCSVSLVTLPTSRTTRDSEQQQLFYGKNTNDRIAAVQHRQDHTTKCYGGNNSTGTHRQSPRCGRQGLCAERKSIEPTHDRKYKTMNFRVPKQHKRGLV